MKSSLSSGSAASRSRVESEASSGYWATNVVDGRRRVLALVCRWLSPLDGLRVADLGCGPGVTVRYLGQRGATVFGVDDPLRVDWTLDRQVSYVAADPGQSIVKRGALDVLLLEAVERYSDSGRSAMLSALADWGVPRLVVVARCPNGWTRLRSAMEKDVEESVIDPVTLLRQVHLQTPYRLVRREEVRQRNYRGLVAEFDHGRR